MNGTNSPVLPGPDDPGRTTEQLRESERRLRLLVDQFAQAVWETDAAGVASADSPGGRAYTGQSREQWLSKGWAGAVHPDERRRACSLWHQTVERGTPLNAEFRLRRDPEGGWRWTDVRAAPLRDADGSIRQWVGMLTDVTARKQAEEAALVRSEAALRQSERQLAAELTGTRTLQTLSGRMIAESDPQALYEQILDAAIALMGSDAASLQLREPGDSGGSLCLLASRGFHPDSARFWARVEAGAGSTCGQALVRRQRVLVDDVDAADFMRGTADLVEYHRSHLRAVQSTPLTSRTGQALGMISTHWSRPHRPSERDFRLFDVLARQAADLVERSISEAALRSSELRLRLLVDSVRDHAVLTLEPDGRVATWNPAAQRIFGYAAEEVVGLDWSVLFTPEDRAAGEHARNLAGAARDGRAADDRWQQRKGGERFWASGVTSAMRDRAGQLCGFTEVLRDETEGKLLEQRREQLLVAEQAARHAAERAMVMRDEFLSVISHELRTPLASILLWSKLAQHERTSDAERARALAMIQQGAEAQQQLIGDLLDMNRILAGKLRLEVHEVQVADVVRAAVDTVRPAADARGVTLDVDLDDWPVAAVDPDRLQQVVWNLLSNAVKFTDGNGGNVGVRLRRTAGLLEIEVKDTGAGIAPDSLPHVFDRFWQADSSTTRAHGGLGLGLAIVKQIVEMHGGAVSAHSKGLGKGASFLVQLPMARRTRRRKPAAASASAASAARHRPDAPPPAPDPAGDLTGLRILLVEDHADTRAATRLVLERAGASVTAVASVTEALEALRLSAPAGCLFDALVSDIGLQGQDGYQLLRHVRASEAESGLRRPPLPALALTAYVRPQDRDAALQAGYQQHLGKPFDPADVVAAVARLVGRG